MSNLLLAPLFKHAPENYCCPFCQIVQRMENPADSSRLSDIVYQDKLVTALVASHQYPRNAPNIIVVPNAHYENIFDLPPELGSDIYRVAQQIAFALKRAYACDGISTRQHNEPTGSQDVWHFHLHVTPRFKNDGFYKNFYDKFLMTAEQRAAHAARVKKFLASPGASADLYDGKEFGV
ncbi:MAG: HIT family protein [Chloroflexi bacterium]|nr:HIT family protein [Chloroflexota bacterium]